MICYVAIKNNQMENNPHRAIRYQPPCCDDLS